MQPEFSFFKLKGSTAAGSKELSRSAEAEHPSTMAKPRVLRMSKELERLQIDPPHGIAVWCKNQDSIAELEASASY